MDEVRCGKFSERLYQSKHSLENVMNKTTLFRYFRSFLIRIALLDGALGVLPESWDPTFAVVLEMKDGEIPADPITKVRSVWHFMFVD